jgi:isopenicillin N synthase-like dioxygenase
MVQYVSMAANITARQADWDSIPVIDLSPWFTGNTDQQKEVAEEVVLACVTCGFFYIVNHQFPQHLLTSVFELAHDFFDLPIKDKEKVSFELGNKNRGYIALGAESSDPDASRDEKEAYDFTHPIPAITAGELLPDRISGKNLWAEQPACLKPVINLYMEKSIQLGRVLFQIFAVGLGLDRHYFGDKIDYPIAQLRLLHYPAQNSEDLTMENLGIGKHCDYECLTILAQEDVGGLQVLNLQGEWIEAPPIEGAFNVNIGEMLTRWTNGKFKATPHRVINTGGRRRYSVAFFFATNYDVNIKPLDVCVTEGGTPQYEEILAGEYLLARLDEIYG